MSLERDLKSLYPFLHGKAQDAAKLGEALSRSVDEKAKESRETNARFFEEQGGALVETAKAIAAVYRRGGRMFSMGNGGSSCDASHFAVEFVHPITTGRPALAAVNLVADLATITAIGNDVGFEHIFTRQLIAQAKSGDGLIGFSTSGNSSNLMHAFAKAKEMGVATIGLAGGDGGGHGVERTLGPLPRRAHDLDPSHPGVSRRRLSYRLGSRAHAARRRSRLRVEERQCGMKYVDEFRDREKAKILVKGIHDLMSTMDTPKDRPLHIMEVCGGHTHSIFRYGVEGMLPKSIELVHGPGCPVCVLPMGRVDDCVSIAERPEVIFTTFGDAMRVPGSKVSLLQAKADGADVRMVYSPMDALALARKHREPRDRVFWTGLRDHDAFDGANDFAGRARRRHEFLGILQSHHHRADNKSDLGQSGYKDRRIFGSRPCVDGRRHAPVRVHRAILPQADGRRRL